jgi:hypothetical protein
MGPGPNCWSDSAESVWVDEQGLLHLRLREIDGTWHSAEVRTQSCAGYGTYRFHLIGRPDELDKNVVLGLFLYKDDDHEIDVEFIQHGEDNSPYNAQYVVQPWDREGNRERFVMSLNGTHSTHVIYWRADQLRFKSFHGHYLEPPAPSYLIREWTYGGADIPTEDGCWRVHVNLWLYGGVSPSDGQEVEIVLRAMPQLFLPAVFNRTSPPLLVTVAASGDRAEGEVGPPSYCTAEYKIALYAKTDIWYVQPYADARKDIQSRPDCTWEARIGAWNQVAAHLVPAGYDHPPQVSKTARCPPPPLDPESNPNVIAAACTP